MNEYRRISLLWARVTLRRARWRRDDVFTSWSGNGKVTTLRETFVYFAKIAFSSGCKRRESRGNAGDGRLCGGTSLAWWNFSTSHEWQPASQFTIDSRIYSSRVISFRRESFAVHGTSRCGEVYYVESSLKVYHSTVNNLKGSRMGTSSFIKPGDRSHFLSISHPGL